MPSNHRLTRASRTLLFLAATLLLVSSVLAVEPAPGEWGFRAELLEPNSEFALAELDGKLYLLGGYPASRVTVRTVQVYDIASDSWAFGPPLPQPNNHGVAASVGGKVYLIGGQTSASGQNSYVDTVYELDPAVGEWLEQTDLLFEHA